MSRFNFESGTHAYSVTGAEPVRERSDLVGRSSLLSHVLSEQSQFTRQAMELWSIEMPLHWWRKCQWWRPLQQVWTGTWKICMIYCCSSSVWSCCRHKRLFSPIDGSSIFSFSMLSSWFPTFAPFANEAAFVDQYFIFTEVPLFDYRKSIAKSV